MRSSASGARAEPAAESAARLEASASAARIVASASAARLEVAASTRRRRRRGGGARSRSEAHTGSGGGARRWAGRARLGLSGPRAVDGGDGTRVMARLDAGGGSADVAAADWPG